MKIAIVHDWLMSQGGAERVLEKILKIFPAPVYTLFQNRSQVFADPIQQAKIIHSFIQQFPLVEKEYRHYLPFFPIAIQQFDLSQYDLIISSSHAVAKGVKTHENQLHLCYCHTPMRYVWDLEEQYLDSMGLLKRAMARKIFQYLRTWDLNTASRAHAFIANSYFVAERINRLYGRSSTVIYPPVNTKFFNLAEAKDDFFLTVSRLVPYKRVDLIVEAFNQMPEKKLKIVGTGPELEKLRESARSNIEFLGFQPDEKVRELLSQAQGFIFAAEDDFGIAPLEAQASGTPVIAYGRGGALETIMQGETGLFFSEQTADCLISAIEAFEQKQWDAHRIREHSQRFSAERFEHEFKQFIHQQWEHFCENRHTCRR